MSISNEELLHEKEYLKSTIEVIENLIKSSNQLVSSKIMDVNKMKTFIWENKSDMDRCRIAI